MPACGALCAHALGWPFSGEEMPPIAKVDQRVQPFDRLGPDRPAIAAIAAIRPTKFDELFTPERHTAPRHPRPSGYRLWTDRETSWIRLSDGLGQAIRPYARRIKGFNGAGDHLRSVAVAPAQGPASARTRTPPVTNALTDTKPAVRCCSERIVRINRTDHHMLPRPPVHAQSAPSTTPVPCPAPGIGSSDDPNVQPSGHCRLRGNGP